MEEKSKNIFLFSVDLEDVRLRVKDGLLYKARVEVLTEQYLEFLNLYNAKATFFTVGDIPEHYPGLVKMIADEGHEIACHSNKHLPVAKQTKDEFKDDVFRNMESLYDAGAVEILGYRAPTFSITQNTSWAFDVLADLGLKYSSSVLPSKNPLYGWENFGETPKKMSPHFWEIPVSLRKGTSFRVPFSGGVYFRVLPFYFIKKSFSFHFENGNAITSYFHPYDIDYKQEKFMHPEINDNWIYNRLLYYNRKNVFHRLHKLMDHFSPEIITYKNYFELLNTRNE